MWKELWKNILSVSLWFSLHVEFLWDNLLMFALNSRVHTENGINQDSYIDGVSK